MLNYPAMIDTTNSDYSAFTPVSTDLASYTNSTMIDSTNAAAKAENYKDFLNNNSSTANNNPIDSNTTIHSASSDPLTERFLMHKGGDNSKRFSVNNLLQLANCTGSKLNGES